MWVCTLPLIKDGPIRAPWPPSSSTRISYHSALRVATGPFRVRFGRPFPRLSSFSKPSTSVSRLANTDASLATLLTIAHAVVTRRRAEVCTLPLSLLAVSEPPGRHPPAPGSHSSQQISRFVGVGTSKLPWMPFLHQVWRHFPLGSRRAFHAVVLQSRDSWASL